MDSANQIKVYLILAIVFGVLAVGVFLYPGVPSTPFGWLIKAVMIIAFGVYLYLLLQDLQLNAMTTAEMTPEEPSVEQTGTESSGARGQHQMELDFTRFPGAGDIISNLNAVQAYRTFQERLLAIIQETLVSHAVMMYIADVSSDSCKLQNSRHPENTPLQSTVPLGDGFLSEILRTDAPVSLSPEGHDDALDIEYYRGAAPTIRSFLGVPIRYQGNPIGILAVDDTVNESYGEQDVALLQRYAEVISSAMVQFDALDQLTDQRDFYAQLCQLNSEINLTGSPEELFRQIVQVGTQLFKYDMLALILLQEQESRQAELAIIEGETGSLKPGYRFELQDSVLSDVIRKGEPYTADHLTEKQTADDITRDLPLPVDQMESLIVAPIRNDSQTYGTLLLGYTESGKLQQKDEQVLMILGAVIGSALNKFYHYRYMKHIATRDGLTNILNYRAFMERLEEEIQRGKRYESPFTLLFGDLDEFKRINDEHGHQYGDRMLQEVARLITANVRSVDIVARYGGEEFAVIVLHASLDDAFKTANRIRETIKNHRFEIDGVRERITISIGMAEYPGHAEDVDALISRADEAMYRVKQVGGNAVKSYKKDQETKEV